MEKVNSQLGGQIRFIRELQGFSQESIALFLGISQQAYQKLESGRCRICEKRLEKIASFLGVDLEKLKNLDKQEVLALLRKGNSPPSIRDKLRNEVLSIKRELKILKQLNQRILEELS